ncbi:GLPGLI family protein [uncultured Chryseobacterium sp.]|uniref:GLPGLI family protein n=1 Tax=uncultured Chryseobacterium sp. TaxID=259322 RepID=UPI0025862653|nr:GLPGLI family protein [uncultured Chryseobacterium sp.]
MKKYLIILLTFLSNFCILKSQSFVVQYEYSKHIAKDSTKIIKQNTFLNINKESSLFFSEAPYLADSLIASDEKLGKKINFKRLPSDFLGCYIQKKIAKKEVTYYSDEFDESEFKYVEKPNFKWDVTKEKKTIMGYSVYLATTKYAGRNYKAYFTKDIPIQEGPYKFFGLPGLILELFDEKMDHHFLAVGISKQKKVSIEDRIAKRKYVETTRPKFLKMRESHAQAPLQRMFELMNSTQIYEKKDANGNTVDLKKLFNETQKKMIDSYNKENKIELQN